MGFFKWIRRFKAKTVLSSEPVCQQYINVLWNGEIVVSCKSSPAVRSDNDNRMFNQVFNGWSTRVSDLGMGSLYLIVLENRLSLWWESHQEVNSGKSFLSGGGIRTDTFFDAHSCIDAQRDYDGGKCPLCKREPVHSGHTDE